MVKEFYIARDNYGIFLYDKKPIIMNNKWFSSKGTTVVMRIGTEYDSRDEFLYDKPIDFILIGRMLGILEEPIKIQISQI